MKFQIGDLVTDDFYEDLGIVISAPRLSADCDRRDMGVMSGDLYDVVDVLCPDGSVKLFTTDELRIIAKKQKKFLTNPRNCDIIYTQTIEKKVR